MPNTQEDVNAGRTPVICYSRVVGWITPTKNWNPGKKSEFGDRKNYDDSFKKLDK